MLDPLGAILTELRDDGAVDALVQGRVRGGEPAPNDGAKPFKRFIVLTRLDAVPFRTLNDMVVQDVQLGFRCYGSTYQDAAQLTGAVIDALHLVGPRLKASGLGIYITRITGGGSATKDPDTGQPYETGVISLFATTQVVAA